MKKNQSSSPMTISDQLLQQVYDLMEQCDKEDKVANLEFDHIVEHNQHMLEIQLSEIDEVRHQIVNAQQRARSLSNGITSVHQLAEGVSSQVRQLHLIQSRVKEALNAIEGNIGLKSCLQGVEEAIRDEDYERAAQYISRVYNLNGQQQQPQITKKQGEESEQYGSSSNGDDNQSIEMDDQTSPSTMNNNNNASNLIALKQSHEKMNEIARSMLKKSLQEMNLENMERFAKLFTPLHIEKDGLIIFTEYLIEQTRSELEEIVKSDLSKVADLKLLDDSEEYDDYNQDEEDSITFVDLLRQVVDIIAGTVESNEQFIVANFGGRDKLIYVLSAMQQLCEEVALLILDSFVKKRRIAEKFDTITKLYSRHAHSKQKLEPVDTRELDLLLEETVTLCSCVEIYEKFVQRKYKAAIANIPKPEYEFNRQSKVQARMQEILAFYIPLDEFFMKKSIDIAVDLTYQELNAKHELENLENESDEESDEDEMEDDSQKCASVVEDTFFVLQKSLSRAITSNNISLISQILSTINSILLDVLKEKIFNLIRNEATKYIGINSLELAQNYVIKLKREYDKMCEYSIKPEEDSQKKKLNSCSSDFVKTSRNFQESVDHQIRSIVDMRIEPSLELIKQWDSKINMEFFVQELERVTTEFKRKFTTNNFDKFIQEIATRLTDKMEKVVMQRNFNPYSALRLDGDIRSLMLYLSNKTQAVVRDKFARLGQISFLLKVNSPEEVLEYWNDDAGMTAINLTSADVKRVLKRREDFKASDIDQLEM